MPGAAVYVAAVVGTVAVAVAFKEFVYEPHIAPRIEQWAEEFIARRRAGRRRALAPPVQAQMSDDAPRNGPGPVNSGFDDDDDNTPLSIELERLVNTEVSEWRQQVGSSNLRRRQPTRLEESNVTIAHPVISPTHVLFDHSEPSSPASTLSMRQRSRLASQSSANGAPQPSPPMVQIRNSPVLPSRGPPTPVSLAASSLTISSVSSRASSPESWAFNSAISASGAYHADVQPAPTSPFSDVHAVPVLSPVFGHVAPLPASAPVVDVHVLSPRSAHVQSDFDFLSASDDEIMSLVSSMSPDASLHGDDLQVLSDETDDDEAGDLSGWTSVGPRR